MFQKTVSGMGMLLLCAAAVSLAALSVALLLGFVALAAVAIAGLYLSAPEDAKTLLKKVPAYIDGWVKDMRNMVSEAGVTLMTVLGKKTAVQGGDAPLPESKDASAKATTVDQKTA